MSNLGNKNPALQRFSLLNNVYDQKKTSKDVHDYAQSMTREIGKLVEQTRKMVNIRPNEANQRAYNAVSDLWQQVNQQLNQTHSSTETEHFQDDNPSSFSMK
ncbi:hypothetical protein [Legionella fairfieldensis]|uniref:Uncharacterized protein n=1 Tax=Legionella fairfieldensis TaxID=45064 RepID=Q49J76_9GAMM|nr:hypothetical protein [Legionella fairfieldensis]AAX56200.1 unknown [Legionella fairfieldensis]